MKMTDNIAILVEKALDEKNQCSPLNEAFTAIVAGYQDLIFAYIYGIVQDHYLARDLTQDVFIIAYNKLQTLANYQAFPFWIKQIARRQALKAFRKSYGRELPWDKIADRPNEAMMGPEQSFERQEVKDEIYDAIRKLPENQRIPVVMYYIDGYSQQDVAHFLAVTVDTVKKRLQRARTNLRKEMMHIMKEDLEQFRPSNDSRLVDRISLYTTFDSVAKIGQLEIMEQMLIDGINVNEKDAGERTLLHWAVENGHEDAVRLLLQNGADPGLTDKSGQTPVQLAKQKKSRAILRLFTAH
jgi:RNA polymerase sigma factor (sigma-70 family)